jgi:sugar O-acyltransferase (sialic acid O-acetyltransferase NeuD family)
MIIAGAGGHALEIMDILDKSSISQLAFFDNIHAGCPAQLQGVDVIKDVNTAKALLQNDPRFVIGTGNPQVRKKLYHLFQEMGGTAFTCTAATAVISEKVTSIGEGCNIMHAAFISSQVTIGKGSLINTGAHLHHHVSIGNFCEIGPAALLLGNVQIGHSVFIGAGAILLPGITVAEEAIIGAGAVVTKNVEAGRTVKGNPAV